MREIKFRAWYDGRMYKESMCEYLSGYGCMFNWFTKPDAPLMQYTGLKDKNGIEIYEGDIVKKHRLIKYVEFKRGAFLLSGDVILLAHFGDTIEVIGNIYENPELLETK